MGRITKIKRQLIEEANKRNLGLIKEDEVLQGIATELSYLEGDVTDLEDKIEDVAYDLHAKLDDDYEGEDEPEELVDILAKVQHAYELANDTGNELNDASFDIDNYLLDLDDEEDDIPVGKSDMDKHLRDKDGRMGSL
jgi:hypothetical protein